jgi:hypothetical protein
MTADEERQYLCDLIMSASEWRLSEGDERDTLRLEIQDRLRRLNGVETEDENGYVQSEPVEVSPVLTEDDYKALEAAKLNEHLNEKREKQKLFKQRWKHGRVRVTIDGKPVWKLERDCHKEIIPGFEKKWHWVWNGNQENENAKKDQVEQMWAEHERS